MRLPSLPPFSALALCLFAPGAALAQVVVNEIDYDQPSTDTAEFIEIRNAGSSPVELTGYALKLYNGGVSPVAQYRDIPLPSTTLAPGAYLVVCGNAATVFPCDLDVAPDTDLIQNGAPDAVALVNGATIVDMVSYEGNTVGFTEGSGTGLEDAPSAGKSIARCPDGVDTNQNNVDFLFVDATPGASNACPPPPSPIGLCGEAATPIHAVQGNGLESPLAGSIQVIEGVVVGDFQGSNRLGGFFLQEE